MNEIHDDAATGMEVAVIGMACRFPGASSVDEFWKNLASGVESITFHTAEELVARGLDPRLVEHPDYVRSTRGVEGFDLFDAAFFGCPPREAEAMDPQHRLLLECAWEALENAGYDAESYGGLIGIYAGARLSEYLFNVFSDPQRVAAAGDLQLQIANDKDFLASRIAYKLGLGGPAVTVQTACSTALVSVHLACQALLAGECDMALAGAVSVKPSSLGYLYREGEILSRDGRVRSFDAESTGTSFGDGLGLVVLRRLEDAQADGDTVRAVIRGSAVNNDSSERVGFTAPGVEGQRRVVRAAHLTAEVDASTIGFVEAHGSGTPTGDPIEIEALTRAFRASTAGKGFCAVGSVKSNVGHLGAAAGAAGLVKTVLALENAQIPPSLGFETPNPQIDFASSPFFVNDRLLEWPREAAPRRAGVSSFGLGGTNAHAVLEEAPPAPSADGSRPWQLLVLSACTETALVNVTERLAGHLESHAGLSLADTAFTLQNGRRPFEHRRILVCRDTADAVAALRGREAHRLPTMRCPEGEARTAFLFSGQGSQHPNMGHGLYRSEPVFRKALDRCAEILEPHLGLDLRELLYPATADEEAAARLAETRYTQPALFAVEHSLARLWASWGIEPEAMLGHSIGEYVAACLAGVFPLEDALALVAARGRLVQALPPGAMLSVPLSETAARARLTPELEIAAVNAPERVVVSGPEGAVDALAERLAADDVAARRLHTSHAFHSAMMEPAVAPFLAELRGIRLERPRIPFLSNVTGTWIRDDEATDPGYWALHLRRTVRFSDGLGELLGEKDRLLLEVGPGNTLTGLAQRHPRSGTARLVVPSLPRPREDVDDQAFCLTALGRLWLAGARPDWPGFCAGERRRRVPLPTYPFERRRYWIERGTPTAVTATPQRGLADWFSLPSWRPSVAPSETAGEPAEWLLFADPGPLADALAARLAERGDAVTHVASYDLAPGEREGYVELLGRLAEQGRTPRRILHLWGVTGEERPGLEAAQERGFYSLLFLAQALAERFPGADVDLLVVTDGLHRLAPGEEICPEKSTVLGPCRVLPREHPRLRCGAVDLGRFEAPSASLIDKLLAEAAAPEPGAAVAYRGGERWVRDEQPVRLDGTDERRLRIRHGGVYLITGGLGGLGLTFAEYLAREHQARLVLTGRSGLPEGEARAAWIARHGEDDRTTVRIRKVEALEALGAEVLVARADVTDEAALSELAGRLRERFGELHGVIHAAGLPGGGLARLKTRQQAARVLAPKVEGTLALAAAFADEVRDFFLLCSSTIAVLGIPGQIDYCAANSFLDAFAESRAGREGPFTVAVAWGAWSEVGMAVETPAAGPYPAEGEEIAHPLLDRRGLAVEKVVYTSELSAARHWFLDEHRIAGRAVLPGTAYLALAQAAFSHHCSGGGALELRDVFFSQPLTVDDGESRETRIVLEPDGTAGFRFRVTSRTHEAAPWTEHARGHVGPLAGGAARHDLGEIRGRCPRPLEVTDDLLADPRKLVSWGPRWRCLEALQLGEDQALARLALPDALRGDLDDFTLHPALLDMATALASGLGEGGAYLPFSYREVAVYRSLPATFYSYLRLSEASGETVSADVTLLDDGGQELVAISGFTMKRVAAAAARPLGVRDAAPAAGLFAAGGMRPAEGVEALRRVLSRVDAPRVLVSKKDLNELRRQLDEDVTRLAAGVAAANETRHERPALSTPYAPPRNDLERTLLETWQGVLGIDGIGVHDNFFELGGDSLAGVTMISQLREAGISIAPEQFFNHQSVAELAAAARPDEPGPAAEARDEGGFDLPPDQLEDVFLVLESLS